MGVGLNLTRESAEEFGGRGRLGLRLIERLAYLPNGPALSYIVVWSVIGLQTMIRVLITSEGKVFAA